MFARRSGILALALAALVISSAQPAEAADMPPPNDVIAVDAIDNANNTYSANEALVAPADLAVPAHVAINSSSGALPDIMVTARGASPPAVDLMGSLYYGTTLDLAGIKAQRSRMDNLAAYAADMAQRELDQAIGIGRHDLLTPSKEVKLAAYARSSPISRATDRGSTQQVGSLPAWHIDQQ